MTPFSGRLRWLAAGLVVSAFAAVAGAGYARESGSPIQQAIDNGARAGTNRFDLVITIASSGKQFALKAKGAVDLRNHRGAFTVDFGRLLASVGLKVGGKPVPSKVEMIEYGNVLYIHLPAMAGEQPGREWLKIDPKTLPKSLGKSSDRSALSAFSPWQLLSVLRAAPSVRALGSQTIGGVRMTHYRVVANTNALSGVTASGVKRLGLVSTSADVWVDSQGFIRRINTVPVPLKSASGTATTKVRMTMNFSAFGSKVTVALPPAAKTVDLGKALSKGITGQPTTTTPTTPTTTTKKPVTKPAPKAPASIHPAVTFLQAGTSLGGALAAPGAANGLVANMHPQTGVVMSAYWLKDGKWLGRIDVPAATDGLVLRTVPTANPGAALARPKAATAFHAVWDPRTGVITGANWTSLGKPLATIPVAGGQRAIAFTNGTG